MSFRGRFNHTLDNKGRVSIPAGFRMEIQTGGNKPFLTRAKDHLQLYPADAFKRVEQDLESKPSFEPNVQEFARHFIGGSSECPLDAQGRITIPAHDRDFADLAGKITLLGVLDKIEIWNQDRYEAAQQKVLESLNDIQKAVSEL